MRGKPHKQRIQTDVPQQFFLRALVGSLVFCAALCAPARAQSPAKEHASTPQEAEGEKFTEINTAPFTTFIARAVRLREDGSISLDDTFDFAVEADRDGDGALRNVVILNASASNVLWHGLAKDFVAAVSDSHLMGVFKEMRHVSLRLSLDQQHALASASSEVESSDRAETLKRNYDMLLSLGRMAKQGKPELVVWDSIRVSASGKQLTVTLDMPREQLGNLLSQSLALP